MRTVAAILNATSLYFSAVLLLASWVSLLIGSRGFFATVSIIAFMIEFLAKHFCLILIFAWLFGTSGSKHGSVHLINYVLAY